MVDTLCLYNEWQLQRITCEGSQHGMASYINMWHMEKAREL